MKKNLLRLSDLTINDIDQIFEWATKIKNNPANYYDSFKGKTITLLFDKTSTRTRLSFQVGASKLGMHSIFLNTNETQMKVGEEVSDTAIVMSSMTDALILRVNSHQLIESFAQHSQVPVINGLTDQSHPCQILADLYTCAEHFSKDDMSVQSIKKLNIAWIGDCNNMCLTYLEAAKLIGFELFLMMPSFTHTEQLKNSIKGYVNIHLFDSVKQDVLSQIDVINTDVWFSLGTQDTPEEKQQKMKTFREFQVTKKTLDQAKSNVLFLHCLPAKKGEEISSDLFEDERSKVWQQAKNREVAQTGLLYYILNNPS